MPKQKTISELKAEIAASERQLAQLLTSSVREIGRAHV